MMAFCGEGQRFGDSVDVTSVGTSEEATDVWNAGGGMGPSGVRLD